MTAATDAAVCSLIDEHRELLPILEEHLAENDVAVLPHVLLPEIVRRLLEDLPGGRTRSRQVIGRLEGAYRRGGDGVRELIAVSAVEMIPDPGEPGSELRDFLGPRLRKHDPRTQAR